MSCLDDSEVTGFARGLLAPSEATEIEDHLRDCSDCRRRVGLVRKEARTVQFRTGSGVTQASRGGTTLPPQSSGANRTQRDSARRNLAEQPQQTRQDRPWNERTERESGGEIEPTPAEALIEGDHLGRYELEEVIGSGGMGVVYAAYDPELDRPVAIKLLRNLSSATAKATEARARLLREAQAMARVSHPNVIAIHDTGTIGDEVFIAMELIDGPNLKDWLRERPRHWSAIVEIFVAAGRGLAAAHAAGLVHRDFKPDNVLLGEDGRARVTDFGLVRADENVAEGTGASALDQPLTRVGAVVGTPGYMSPEQYEGREADARADQFSFCVALYEALYDERLFDGESLKTLAKQAHAGAIPDPPPGSEVPPVLHAVVLRGLNVKPEARYPSMTALLDDLEFASGKGSPLRRAARFALRGLEGGRRHWAGARRWVRAHPSATTAGALAALVIASGGMAVGKRGIRRSVPECSDAAQRWAAAWEPQRRTAVEQTFLGTQRAHARASFEAFSSVLERFGRSWLATHTAGCPGKPPLQEDRARAQANCLSWSAMEADALVARLTRPTPSVVDRAVEAMGALPHPSTCLHPGRPRAAPAARELDALRGKLAEARAIRETTDPRLTKDAGELRTAAELAEAVVQGARAVRVRPLEAEALLFQGELQHRTGQTRQAERTLQEAAAVAAAGEHDQAVARAFTALVQNAGADAARRDQGLLWGRLAAGAIERLGGDEVLEAELVSAIGMILLEQARHADALAQLERALTLRERIFGPDHPRTWASIRQVASALGRLGRHPAAVELLQRGLALREAVLGPDHPDLALALTEQGRALEAKGDMERAVASYKRALEIHTRAQAAEHPDAVQALTLLAAAHHKLGQHEKAIADWRRALELSLRGLGPDHPTTATARKGLQLVEASAPPPTPAPKTAERRIRKR
jgi:tetratricopeptide (TPR) repeat protein